MLVPYVTIRKFFFSLSTNRHGSGYPAFTLIVLGFANTAHSVFLFSFVGGATGGFLEIFKALRNIYLKSSFERFPRGLLCMARVYREKKVRANGPLKIFLNVNGCIPILAIHT